MPSPGVIAIAAIAIAAVVIYKLTSRNHDQSNSIPLLKQVKSNFTAIDPKYSDIPLRTGDSAYTENKEVITLCLTDPVTGKNYDINTIMYVALHELAHVVTPEGEEEHGSEFKKNFANLLKTGSRLGVYNPNKPIPATYCKVGTR